MAEKPNWGDILNNAIQNQASLVDPKEILKKENESKKEDA